MSDRDAGFEVTDEFERFSQKYDVFRRSFWDDRIRTPKAERFYRTYRDTLDTWRTADGFTQRDYALRNASWHVSDLFTEYKEDEDRREGFIQSVLVAPVGRWPVLVGKVLGGSAIAWVQAVVFLALALLIGTASVGWTLIPLLGLMALVAVGMCSLGMIVAWPMESTQGFHAIMMLALMPMWLLSGAVFPYAEAHVTVKAVMLANPLTYGMAAFRRSRRAPRRRS